MNQAEIFRYYSQEFVAEIIVDVAKDREVVGVFSDGSYDKRPNILNYKSDLLNMVKNGVTSIHMSVEHWAYPMHLSAENYEHLRTGFDIIIDIDSRLSLDESKITAVLICDLLQKYDIKNYGIKFSGRRGFHICIPWKMIPKEIDFKSIRTEYPRIPRLVSDFIRHCIREELLQKLIKNKNIVFEGEIDPFQFVEVEKDWGNRHLFRAPLSLNEKTWLVSKPISYNELKKFDVSQARPENITEATLFFREAEENEAEYLISDAMDWFSINTKKDVKKKWIKKNISTKRIDEDLFPPCIKLILAGLKDGKKRSLFTVINFLMVMNWSWEDIESKLLELNEKNIPKLPRTIISGQINWARQQNRQINPANCSVDQYYKSIAVCQPDNICAKNGVITIKNPISYPFIRLSKMKRITDVKDEENKDNKLVCYVCKKKFKTMKSLINHKQKSHA